MLAEARAAVNAADGEGATPLHAACYALAPVRTLLALLDAAADVRAVLPLTPDRGRARAEVAGVTALHAAVLGLRRTTDPGTLPQRLQRLAEVCSLLVDRGVPRFARCRPPPKLLHALPFDGGVAAGELLLVVWEDVARQLGSRLLDPHVLALQQLLLRDEETAPPE